MHKVAFIALIVLTLAGLAVASYIWVSRLVNSIYGYTSPLKGAPPLTEDSSRPLTSQVVLVVVDGLRYDASLQMPHLNALRKDGAHAALTLHSASSSQTAWTALISGASPEINGAPLFDAPYEGIRPITVDTLFTAINRAGLTGGIAGYYAWEKLVSQELLYTKYYAPRQDDTADRAVVDRALVFLKEFQPNFLLVHLVQINTAGQVYGAASSQYREAVLHTDELIHTVATNMNLSRSVLIVVSSYGQLDQGGHGGDEAVLLSTPFIMVGENVLTGDYKTIDQTDLAPTVAALLGTPTPNAAQGRARLDMLHTDRVEKAERLVAVASQRVRVGNIYLYSIGKGALSETAEGDMQVARSSLQVKNYQSAAELATLSIEQTDRETMQARRARIWKERSQRMSPFALAVLILLWALWHWRGWRAAWTLLAAIVAGAGYHALALQQGDIYSFSRIPAGGLGSTLNPSIVRASIALAGGALIIIWRTWRERERTILAVLWRIYAYAILLVYLIGLAVSACAVWNGLRFTWYLPNLKVAYIHFATLMQLMITAALAILLPIPAVALQRIVLAISDRYRKREK